MSQILIRKLQSGSVAPTKENAVQSTTPVINNNFIIEKDPTSPSGYKIRKGDQLMSYNYEDTWKATDNLGTQEALKIDENSFLTKSDLTNLYNADNANYLNILKNVSDFSNKELNEIDNLIKTQVLPNIGNAFKNYNSSTGALSGNSGSFKFDSNSKIHKGAQYILGKLINTVPANKLTVTKDTRKDYITDTKFYNNIYSKYYGNDVLEPSSTL